VLAHGNSPAEHIKLLLQRILAWSSDFLCCGVFHGQIIEARNRRSSQLLVSEDLDELLKLIGILVISGGIL